MDYSYPLVIGGYRWNLLQRCFYEVGIEPVALNDMGDQTILTFTRVLTPTEKTKLDILMADDPTFPPKGGGGFIIKDIYENFPQFKIDAKLPLLQLYYSASASGGTDQIQLWNPTALTNSNKNNLRTAYSNLIITV